MAYDFLRDHALKNVWCTPDQDTQAIFELAKITPYGGAKKQFKVLWNYMALPDQNSTWHLFQIGQIHPLILGLYPKVGEWMSFESACNIQKLVCDIYNVDGVQLPRFESFYCYTQNRNLLVAIKRNDNIPFRFNEDNIYLRLYSNEYFVTERAHNTDDFIFVKGTKITSTQDILDLQSDYDDYTALEGQTYAFVNGLKVDKIDLVNVAVGDTAEFVYDSSIYKVVDFLVSDLLTFESILDAKRKYMLHYAGEDNGTIDYQDDIDVFVLKDEGSDRHSGLFYHKNNADSFRNLTHRDYSAVVQYVVRYMSKLQSLAQAGEVITSDQIYLRLHIRKSGYQRSLIYENNRIHELYRMQDEDIAKAMLGIDSTVSNWRAEVLENSDYTRIMRSTSNSITRTMVQDGYGYNGISFISGNTPSETYIFSGLKAANVPYVLQKGCTAYEYDTNGKMIGWHFHSHGTRYMCASQDAALVEFIGGKGGNILNETYGFTSTPYVREYDFRVYQCKRVAGSPDNNFIDITEAEGKYSLDNGRIHWLDENPTNYPMVRFNSHFLAYDTQVSFEGGQLKLTLNHLQNRNNTISNWVMQVPMGEIDVFLNGKSLIRNLDYVLQFPEIIINNKEYLIDPLNEAQDVHVRFTGFCTKELQLNEINDVGFVEHGVLSNNYRYNIRDDKVLRITMDGDLKTRDDLVFSEFHSGVSTLDPLNGKPYQIKDIVVPLRGIAVDDTYTLRNKSVEIDNIVSDYLSKKIPQPPRPAPTAIENRYPIYSPFIAKILHDLVNSVLIIEDKIHNKAEALRICKQYEYLLKFDPTQEEQAVDDRYVIIHPHAYSVVLGVPLNTYRFIDLINRTYTRGLVSLSPFLIIA